MENVNTLMLGGSGYPDVLSHIPAPPKQIYYIGQPPASWLNRPRVAVVGSRKVSIYGEAVTRRLAGQLASYGVVIISGLAYGVDAVAHRAALDAGGITAAVLAGGLNTVHPAQHLGLARQIISSGGTLLSEYEPGRPSLRQNFIARNRIVSGLADVLLITEASISSGTMHTAKFALEQGKTVMAVPGNITSPGSEGTNNLIKSGALPATEVGDVLFSLKLNQPKKVQLAPFKGSSREAAVLELITGGITNQEELIQASHLDSSEFSSVLTMLEISGYVRPLGSGMWDLA